MNTHFHPSCVHVKRSLYYAFKKSVYLLKMQGRYSTREVHITLSSFNQTVDSLKATTPVKMLSLQYIYIYIYIYIELLLCMDFVSIMKVSLNSSP